MLVCGSKPCAVFLSACVSFVFLLYKPEYRAFFKCFEWIVLIFLRIHCNHRLNTATKFAWQGDCFCLHMLTYSASVTLSSFSDRFLAKETWNSNNFWLFWTFFLLNFQSYTLEKLSKNDGRLELVRHGESNCETFFLVIFRNFSGRFLRKKLETVSGYLSFFVIFNPLPLDRSLKALQTSQRLGGQTP